MAEKKINEGLPDCNVPRPVEFYLASPFFNPAQVKLVEDIERAFEYADIKLFSPRLCDENKKGPPDDAGAEIIYRRNMVGLLRCTHMLAVVDWKLPEGQLVELRDYNGIDPGRACDPAIGRIAKLNIPDSGTVYEMGAARMKTELREMLTKNFDADPFRMLNEAQAYLETFASNGSDCARLAEEMARFRIAFNVLMAGMCRMPVVIYTERDRKSNLNLMLTKGCAGVISGQKELTQFLGEGQLQWNIPRRWTGGNR